MPDPISVVLPPRDDEPTADAVLLSRELNAVAEKLELAAASWIQGSFSTTEAGVRLRSGYAARAQDCTDRAKAFRWLSSHVVALLEDRAPQPKFGYRVIFKESGASEPVIMHYDTLIEALEYYDKLCPAWTAVELSRVLIPDANSVDGGVARAARDALAASAPQEETNR